MSYCLGKYRIPGIFCNERNIINMQEQNCLFIKLVSANTYNVDMMDMVVDGSYIFAFDIHYLKVCFFEFNSEHGSLQFTGSCKHVDFRDVSCIVDFPNVKSFDTMILQRVSYEIASILLPIPARYIEVDSLEIFRNISLSSITEYARIKRVNSCITSYTNTITLNSNCKNVSVLRNSVPVDISTIIRYSDGDGKIYSTKSTSYDLIITDKDSHLQLTNIKMDGNWQLVKEIKSLELKSISSKDASFVFSIVHELESISITKCRVNICLSYPDRLKKMCIQKSNMIYDPHVYSHVKCISLIGIQIGRTLVLSDVVEDVCIKYVCIREDKSIVLSSNTMCLYVCKTIGTIDMSASIINCKLEVEYVDIIQLEKTASNEFILDIQNVHFSDDCMFSQQLKVIKLRSVKANGCIVRISGVHQVEIDNCRSKIRLFNSSDEADTFIQEHDIGRSGLLVLSDIHTLKLQNKTFYHSFKLPNCTAAVILEKIKMKCGTELMFNEECEEVHLLSCKGKFNLTNLTKLRKLVFVSSMYACDLFVGSLNNLQELEIGGDVDDDYIVSMMSLCHNLKKLTLHNPMVSYKKGNDRVHIYYENVGWYALNNTKVNIWSTTTGEDTRTPLFSTDNNVDLLSKIFNFEVVNKLEYLDISRLFLDYNKIEIWNKFKKLHTIIMNYDSIEQMSSKNIPNNIKTLKCVKCYRIESNKLSNNEHAIVSSKNTEIQNRITNLETFCTSGMTKFFYNLPPYVEKLTITSYGSPVWIRYYKAKRKLHVKELVLNLQFDNYVKILEYKNSLRKNYNIKYFLQNIIDFDKLERFAITTTTTKIYLNPKTHQPSNQ